MENLRSSSTARYRPLPPSTALYRPCFRTNTVSCKELLAGAPHIRPVAHQPRRRRQAFEDHGAVTLRNHAAVQQHDCPHVRAAADQAPEPLLELQGRIGDEVVREAVQTARLQPLQPRGRERLRRYLEGQLRENQHPQRASGYVDALPERVRSKQNPRACLPEASQQVVARSEERRVGKEG